MQHNKTDAFCPDRQKRTVLYCSWALRETDRSWGANMKKLLGLAIVLALAAVLMLTKPTPQEIASAATGQMNYIVINREKMPPDFAAAAVIQTVEDVFSIGVRGANSGVQWRTTDLVFLMYSDLTVSRVGSLKCLWLLRNGFCSYIPR